MKKYRTSHYDISIVEIEILRETESSVFVSQRDSTARQYFKMTGYCQYHDTWLQAYEYLLKQALECVAQTERHLSYEVNKLRKIEAMKEDT